MLVVKVLFLLLAAGVAEEPIIKVDIDNHMTDKRQLSFARGSSACWGLPGLAPQMDGSINVVPDENNFACTCSDHTECDYYQHLFMPLYLDSKLDIFHRHEELIGQVKFAGVGKNVSGKVEWTFQCLITDPDSTHKISCDKMASPDPSTYFLAYKVSLTNPTKDALATLPLGVAEEPIIKVDIENKMTDKRQLRFARGSSSCWGIPGLAPQMDGSINVVPDEGNFACPCSDHTKCDYYQHLLMPLYLDSKLDIFHRHNELIGQVKFSGLGKNISGKVQWSFQCLVIDADATHKISCDAMASPDPSMYFLAYKVSLTSPTKDTLATLPLGVAEEPIIKVDIENKMTDTRQLRFARGSSACWGLPGLAPQMDGSINVVPDEGNFACPCSDHTTCDYYQHLLMPLYLDSKLDIFHRHNELIGQVKFAGMGKNTSGKVQWTFQCDILDPDGKHTISCDEMASPDPSLYFLAYKVSLTSPTAYIVV